ncbi:MAG: biotin--[acetyl-CoA-carboxylase] ligase [Desulfobulbaceae bacterium]|nr:biotin--[acetyl-CoA-carboxylase] ligase [Desulfobulbaceae bacterium]HIJ78088.1 biotin--[acetyl-CoA-carboxylase] ligase [Deltaproteobacteria bacterium]
MERLSHSLIRQIITDEDRPRRLEKYSAEVVAAVYRYGDFVGSSIESYPLEGRLMERARQLVADCDRCERSFPSGMVLLAHELTESRGRFRRVWHAPPGGLWMTLVIANTLLPASTALYPLAAGLACCEAVRQYEIDAKVKWVNDVQVSGRKICGILAETFTSPKYNEEYILIGVGVNVNNQSFPPELGSLAVSMRDVLGREIDLELFAARLLAKFVWSIGLLHHEEQQRLDRGNDDDQADHLHPVLEGWRELTDCIGRQVWFGYDVQEKPQYRAKVMGLDPSGGLILKHQQDGVVVVEHAGEIMYID